MLTTLFLMSAQAETSFSVEYGNLRSADDSFRMFNDRDHIGTLGARLGVGLSDGLDLIADWQHAARGGEVYYGYEPYYDDDTDDGYYEDDYGYGYGYDSGFSAAFTADALSVGPRAYLTLTEGFRPYVALQGQAIRGRIRFDEDRDAPNNVNEIKEAALAFGGAALGGIQLVVGDSSNLMRLSGHLEMGYSTTTNMQFDTFGDFAFRGFAIRTGVGLVF